MPYLISKVVSSGRMIGTEFQPEPTAPIRMILAKISLGHSVTNDEIAALPKTLLVSREGKPLRGEFPHFLGPPFALFFISEQVRNLLEDLEPGTHCYAAVAVKSKGERKIKGKTDHGTFFLIASYPTLDALVIEKTQFGRGFGRAGWEASSKPEIRSEPAPCVFNSEVVKGHHFWRLPPPFTSEYVISDEFHDRLKREKLTGWTVTRRCECGTP